MSSWGRQQYGGSGGGWHQQQQVKRPTPSAYNAPSAPRNVQSRAPLAPGTIVPTASVASAHGAGAAAAAGPETYVVFSKVKDESEVVVRTLIGEYVESGTNHGRKVFKKMPDPSGEYVDVYMYYWDGRDGPSFEGWWFGNQLGGTQVWSHCEGGAMSPPSTGWKIPWDGAVRPSMCVQLKAAKPGQGQAQATGSSTGLLTGPAVQEVSNSAKKAVEEARAFHAGKYADQTGLKAAEDVLMPHSASLGEALKKLMEQQRGATGEAQKQYALMGTVLRATQGQVTTELTKIRAAKAKAEEQQKQRASDEKDGIQLQEVLPEATQKTNTAEDAVEKAVITAEMIESSGDDMDEVRNAVTQTEQAAQEAQKAIGEARIFLNAKQASCRRFESEAVKAEAQRELGKLMTQLQASQQKLNPLKNVRQDFVQRTAAQKLVAETLDRLSPAEVDVDKAEEATVLLLGDSSTSKESMQAAQATVDKATDHVNGVMKFIMQKKATATGMPRDELAKLEERCKGSLTRLMQLKAQHKEAGEKIICSSLLEEAAEKLTSVVESVAKAADAEGPFLMGVEELPLDEALAAIKSCEASTTSANTAVSIARMFIATKLVEAKRFAPEPSKEAQEKLKAYQVELETHIKKLNELKRTTAQRKKAATMREAEAEVAKAERLVKEVADAAEAFSDDSKFMAMTSAEIRTASEQTLQGEQKANAALAEARKFITARQIESKGKEMSTEVSQELIKYQTRLSTAQAEVGKFKKLCGSVEQKLVAKRVIEDATAKMAAVQEKIGKVSEAVEGMDAEPAQAADGAESGKKTLSKVAEGSAAEAQVALKQICRYLDQQTRLQGAAKEELEKMRSTASEAQTKLNAMIAAMREKSEKILVDGLIQEVDDRVQDAETQVEEAAAKEQPFLAEEEAPVAEASAALQALETAVQAAHTAVGGGKTFLAMKRLAAKRLSENAAKTTMDHIATMQVRLEAATKKLAEIKKGMAERKIGTLKREAEAKVVDMEDKVRIAVETTEALGMNLSPEDMLKACEKAGTTQKAATEGITDTKKFLDARARDARSNSSEAMAAEVSKLQERLQKAQADLETQKKVLREQEHKFVAQRLLTDATGMVTKLESLLQTALEQASPLIADGKDLAATAYLAQCMEVLRKHATAASKSMVVLFEEIGDQAAISEDRFVAFMLKLPEMVDGTEPALAEDQLQAAFRRMDAKGGGMVGLEEWQDSVRVRFVVNAPVSMTEDLAVRGSKTVRKLEVNEVIEQIGEPLKEPTLGMLRIKAKCEKDGKEGYLTMEGSQGTVYLVPHDPTAVMEKVVQQAVKELTELGEKTQKYVDNKIEELKSVHKGPLAETKTSLVEMGPRIRQVAGERKKLRTQVMQARKKQQEAMEAEKARRQEAHDRAAAARLLAQVTAAMDEAEQQAGSATSVAQALIASNGAEEEKPFEAMDKAEKDLEAVSGCIEAALAMIKEHMETVKNASKGPFSEARAELSKNKVKVQALENKCKKQIGALAGARKQVSAGAAAALKVVLKAHVMKMASSVDDIFKQLAPDGPVVAASNLRSFLEAIPDHGLKASQLDLGVERLASTLTKLTLADMLQEYQKVVKDVALTTSYGVKESKTVRKLLVDEMVEVLEQRRDEATGLARVRCRALQDSKEGWGTLKGNQGTAFMERCSKPYFCCEEPATLQAEFASTSEEVSKVGTGDVLEVLEGPRQEDPLETVRVRGTASKEGKMGWATLKDAAGRECLEVAKLMICKQSIAITTTFDITEGKAIRKLDVGEAFEILEGPKTDEVRSLTRVKARTKNDSKEGWVTLKGNQGTAFADESTKHYVCKVATNVEKRFASGSEQICTLAVGDVFEVSDGPKTEKVEGMNRVRGRNISDGKEGWFTVTKTNFQRWAPKYKCCSSTVINDSMNIKDAKPVRKLEAGELVEALESPVFEKGAGLLRIRVRAEKDGATGYATVRGNQGTMMLKAVLSGGDW